MKKMLLLAATLFAATSVMAMNDKEVTNLKNELRVLEAALAGTAQKYVDVTLSPNVNALRGSKAKMKPAASVVQPEILERKQASLAAEIAATRAKLDAAKNKAK